MKQILVPTDFSACADNAIDFAVQLSKIIPSKITLFHSFEVADSMYADYIGSGRGLTFTMLNEAEEKLIQLQKNIKESDGVMVHTKVSTDSLQETLSEYTREQKADMVVMGTLGASGIKEKLLGSRTASAITVSGVPVMVIPIEYVWKKPQKILLVTNQFEKSSGILGYLFELAGLFMAQVQVAVFTDEDDDNARTFIDHEIKIFEYETFLKETYHDETMTSSHLYGKDFETSLQDFIRKNDVDMLVMITYQKKLWNRIFNPGKTRQMSYHTTIPLLAIPADESEAK